MFTFYEQGWQPLWEVNHKFNACLMSSIVA